MVATELRANPNAQTSFEACAVLLAKIRGVGSVNDDIILRILDQSPTSLELTYGYSYAFRAPPRTGRCGKRKHRKKKIARSPENVDPLQPSTWTDILDDRREEELPAGDLDSMTRHVNVLDGLLKKWAPSHAMELRHVPDVFNDKLEMCYYDWNTLVNLNDDIVEVAAKYELFGESRKASKTLRDFLHNLEVIQVELGGIERKLLALGSDLKPEVTVEESEKSIQEFQEMIVDVDKLLMIISERVRMGFVKLVDKKANKFCKNGKVYTFGEYAKKYVIPKTNATSLSILSVLPDEIVFGGRKAVQQTCTYVFSSVFVRPLSIESSRVFDLSSFAFERRDRASRGVSLLVQEREVNTLALYR